LLCEKSPFFDRILSTFKVIYPGVFSYGMNADVDAFSSAVEWLYRGPLAPPTSKLSEPLPMAFKKSQVDLYILAVELEMMELANIAMEHLGIHYSLMNRLPATAMMEVVFSKAKEGSSLQGTWLTHIISECTVVNLPLETGTQVLLG
jgi:hypothetical protein